MVTNDKLRQRAADCRVALALLTRLPMPGSVAMTQGTAATSAWAWPLVGALVGVFAALAATLALTAGATAGVAAALALATQAIITGAMHEDGLADSADGLWGGWERVRRLEIMKDSHIGSYGVLALILCTLARWSALVAVLSQGAHWPVLITVGALSRVPMALIMAALPNARDTGLSHATGRPEATTAVAALTVGLGLALILTGAASLPMAALVAAAGLGVALLAKAKIGGQTGDILGASQQLAEMAALSAAAATLA